MADRPPLEITVSRHFLGWLHESGISLACTTYQTNRLFLIGAKPDGTLSAFERAFDRPMGLTATAERLYLSTRWQIWRFDDALPAGETYRGYDRCYVPRQAITTGDLDVHDMALDGSGRLVFVNTAYSCLATPSERYSFTPLWQPPFISRLAAEDRCHLNGLAIADGAPAYVTAVSRSDVTSGWRQRREQGGCVIDVEDGEIVIDTLSMPHSPRLYDDRLLVLNSGAGELGWVDRATRRFEPIAFCPGFLRGLAIHRHYAIVGLSQSRRERAFAGLALDDRLREKDAEPRCGLWVVDLRSGTVAHWLQFEGVVIELYDVAVLPNTRRPMALGFQSDEIQRLITIDAAGGPIFQALATEGGATAAAARPAVPGAPQPAPSAAPAPPPLPEVLRRLHRDANRLARSGALEAALPKLQEVLRQAPDHVPALIDLGAVQHQRGERAAAADCYQRALAADPDAVRAHTNLALLRREAGDLAAALRHYDAARRLAPDDGEILTQLGLTLYEDGQLEVAESAFRAALQRNPRSAEAANNLAGVRKVLGDRLEALALHERAAALDPTFFAAQENIGKIYEEEQRTDEAKAAYQRALGMRDDPVLALHAQLLCPPVFASTAALDLYRQRAAAVIEAFRGRQLSMPFERVQSSRAEPPYDWAYQGRDNAPLKRAYAALFADGLARPPLTRAPSRAGPWHLGVVVTPSHEGVFARCLGGVLARLDARRFRVTLICARPGEAVLRGTLPARLQYLSMPLRFDHAHAAIAAASFDLLYYWEVGTDSTNYFLPFCRLAPLQVTGWGWPDTSGAPALDAHLTSAALAGPEADALFTEPLVRLPHLPAFMSRPPLTPRPSARQRHGLPARAALYVCVQNLRKLHSDFDAMLGAILRADPTGLVLGVEDTHPMLGRLLRARWAATLPDVADRIRLLPRLEPNDYFDLVASADVVLDTPYFGGANTAYDAFAAAVPIVTWPTQFPRSRYGAALYQMMGLGDAVASSADDYVMRAVTLGTDGAARARLSAAIAAQSDILFDNPTAITQFEDWLATALRG
jgi:protein O-GlcNAc transferase